MTEESDDFPSPQLADRVPKIRVITDPIAMKIVSRFSQSPNNGDISEEREEVATEDFKRAFALRTFTYSLLVILVITLIGVIESQTQNLNRQIYGLAIDLVGAIILGRGLLSPPSEMVANATAGYGGPMPVFRANQALDAADGIWGISLLIIGILCQSIVVIGAL